MTETSVEAVRTLYEQSRRRIEILRKRLNRPLTLAEKILLSHLDDPEKQELNPGTAFLLLRPDRVAMQDATAQMAILQFMLAGRSQAAVPTTVHCDHLIQAYIGAAKDTAKAIETNREVYDFLKSASSKYGMGFWGPGAGIIHQVVLENYAFPGGMMIGTDSHTPNAGGLAMIAIGVGGADAADVMSGLPWEVLQPKLVGVKLTGKLTGWTAPKDIILRVCEVLTTKGGTNRILEYFGPGARTISATGKATITNMGAELGATTSIFPYDKRSSDYLRATERAAIADLADTNMDLLEADADVEAHPEKYFDKVIEIDLSTLEPYVVGPHSPDRARPISKLAQEVCDQQYPDTISTALIGSCTNSSYEDISRAADVARQATAAGIKSKSPLMITPGSEQIFETIKRDGQLQDLEKVGGLVLANACGPCIGQWKRDDIKPGQKNTILNSYNRNFPRRNDGNADTLSFIGSPELVVAMGIAGRLSFNPLTDILEANGKQIRLSPPPVSDDIPKNGFVRAQFGYSAPAADPSKIQVTIKPDSDRLQMLKSFEPWNGKDFEKLPLLLKARGACTTDAISPAGVWLKYRGHLDKISDNMFLGAINSFTGEAGKGTNLLTGEREVAFAQIARAYQAKKLPWIAVGDENYGEGSSREHAAMSPRFLGAAAIIARSFARIHETNLKKQGVLPLAFKTKSDYDKVQESDHVSLTGLSKLAPGSEVTAVLHHADGKEDRVTLTHSLNPEQIEWFKAGSALNRVRMA